MNGELIQDATQAFHAKDYSRAERLLRQAIDECSDDIAPRYHLANLLSIQNRLDEAVSILEPIKEHPAVASEHQWMIFLAYRAAGRLEEACELAYDILRHESVTRERLKEILLCARQAGRFSFAVKLGKHVGDQRAIRDVRWIRLLYHSFLILPALVRSKTIFAFVRRLKNKQRFHALQLILEAACHADPREPLWPVQLGKLIRMTRDVYQPNFNQEKTWYEHALRMTPHFHDAQYGLILTLYDMGRWSDCLYQIEQSKIENTITIQRIKAACLANLEKWDQAEELYQSLEKTKHQPHALINRALIALKHNHYEQASQMAASISRDHEVYPLAAFIHDVAETAKQEQSLKNIDGQTILNKLSVSEYNPSLHKVITTGFDKCFLCGNERNRRPLWQDGSTGWIRVRCPKCNMISVAPMPSADAIRSLYSSENRQGHTLAQQYKEALQALDQAKAEDCHRLPLYQEITQWGDAFDWVGFESGLPQPKRYLDIGCSAGKAVKLFQLCGWQAEGIDLDEEAIEFGQQRGLNLQVGSIDTINEDNAFHLITMIDVIEHVADPKTLIHQCKQLLARGGLLFIKTPCADSLPHRFIGNAWLESKEHLHFFSRKTLQHVLDDCELTIISYCQTMEAPTPFLHPNRWLHQFYPEWLYCFIDILQVGDTVSFLAKK